MAEKISSVRNGRVRSFWKYTYSKTIHNTWVSFFSGFTKIPRFRCVCVCVCVCVWRWWTTWKRFEINRSFFFHHLVGQKRLFNYVFGDVVAHDLDLFLEGRVKFGRWRSKYYYCQHRKSRIGFGMVYLHLTLAHSKCQSQGHTNFDCEYLVNDDRMNISTADTESCSLTFEWCISIWHMTYSKGQLQSHKNVDWWFSYIWHWVFLNVKVTVICNSIATKLIIPSHDVFRRMTASTMSFLA